MSKLTIVVNVPEVDSTLNDPHEIAEDILYDHQEGRRSNGDTSGYYDVEFVSAEWET